MIFHINHGWKAIPIAEVATVLVIWTELIQQKITKRRYEALFIVSLFISFVAFSRAAFQIIGLFPCVKIRNTAAFFTFGRKSFENIFCLSTVFVLGWMLLLDNDSSSSACSTLLLPVMLLIWPSFSALHHMSLHPLTLAACWVVCTIFLFLSCDQFRNNIGESITLSVLSLVLLFGSYSATRLNEEEPTQCKSRSAVSPSPTGKKSQLENADEEEERSQRNLIANVAHDMKSPLAALESGCEALKTSLERISHFLTMFNTTSDDHSGLDHSSQAVREVQGMEETLKLIFGTCGMVQAMINRYTDYAKAQLGTGLHANLTSFALDEIVQSIAEIFSLMQHRVKITTVAAVADEDKNDHGTTANSKVLLVRADRQWVFESLLCLVSNAVKYCSNSHQKNSFRMSSRSSDDEHMECSYYSTMNNNSSYHDDSRGEVIIRSFFTIEASADNTASTMIRIEVEDNGCGVSEELQKELFTPLNMRRYTTGGTGLGLYILAQRMTAMGGEYGYSNCPTPGKGSVFWFALPAAVPPNVVLSPKLKVLSNELSALVRSHYVGGAKEDDDSSVLREAKPTSLVASCSHHLLPPHLIPPPIDIPSSSALPYDDPMPPPDGDSHHNTKSPASSAEEQQQPKKATLSSSQSPSHFLGDTPKRQYKFLVVDDAMPILRMTRRMLENEGHIVFDAVDGSDALHMLSSFDDNNINCGGGLAVDIVLMDIQMPVMDGIEATKQFRLFEKEEEATNRRAQIAEEVADNNGDTTTSCDASAADLIHHHQPHHKTIVIGCSANSDHVTIADSLAAGMDAFIPKPVTMKKVYDTLQQLDCLK